MFCSVLKIAVFVFGYPPAFRGGGPIVSVSRICRRQTFHEVRVLTRDREGTRGSQTFGFPRRQWRPDGNVLVSNLKTVLKDLLWAISEIRAWNPDVYYINSLHGRHFALLPLLLIRLRVLKPGIVLIAPRGETSEGSQGIKPRKKRLGKRVIRALLSQKVIWHAASSAERNDIERWLKKPVVNGRVIIERDPAPFPLSNASVSCQSEPLILTFASRIHPTKGLVEAIALFGSLDLNLRLVVHGVVEDENYWNECQVNAEQFANLTLVYEGEYRPDEAQAIFASSDLAILLSKGESFGHSIAEALSVGCPVVISAKTPWNDVVNSGVGIASDDSESLKSYVREFSLLTSADRQRMRSETLANYTQWFQSQANEVDLFTKALELGRQQNR